MPSQQKPVSDMSVAMTVNERLFLGGQLDAWDDAVRRRDSAEMRHILQLVGFPELAAIETTTAVLSPYGL
jgi:hypothetical protein